MRFLVIPTGTGEQAALLVSRARLGFSAGSQRAFLVVTTRQFMSVKRLAEHDSRPEADTKTTRDTSFTKILLYQLVGNKSGQTSVVHTRVEGNQNHVPDNPEIGAQARRSQRSIARSSHCTESKNRVAVPRL